jgi:hypothetical protein
VTQSGVALTACGHYSDFGQRDSIVSMARGSFALSYGYGRANELAVAKQIPASCRSSSNAR